MYPNPTVLSIILLIVPSICAIALPAQAARDNLFLHNNINCSLIEIRGRATIGGNVDINTVQIGCQVYSPDSNCQSFGTQTCSAHPGDSPILRVGGYLNAVNSQVFDGSVIYGGALISAPQVVSDCSVSQQAPGGAYDSEYSSLVSFQSDLTAAYASRGSAGTNNGGNLIFSGTGQSVESFTLGSQTPSSLYSITLQNVNPSSTVVIFVNGESFDFHNIGFQGQFQALANHIIWSFAAISINIRETTWYGTILAPNAFLYSTGAQFNGQVFAASYYPSSGSQCSTVNLVPFTGTFPSSSTNSSAPTTAAPTTAAPTTAAPITAAPTTAAPTTAAPTTAAPTTAAPTTAAPTTAAPTSQPSSQPATSNGGAQSCNGQNYQADSYTCATNEKGQQVLCPKNFAACGQACYNTASYCCQSGTLQQAGQCTAPSQQPTSSPTTAQPTTAQPTSAQPTSSPTTQQTSTPPSTSGGVQSCNGQPIYQPDQYTCATNEKGQQVLCPKNYSACGGACYSPSSYCCQSGSLQQAGTCH